MSESEYKTWHALGFGSNSYTELRALLTAQPQASRCPDCGYLTSQREHLGCLRKAVAELDAATGGQPQASAAQSAPDEREAAAAAIAEEIDGLIRQWDAKVSWSGERMAELLEAAGKAFEMLAAWQRAQSAPAGAVPEGWHIERTPDGAFCLSSDDHEHRSFFAPWGHKPARAVSAFLEAMLAAAPAQPAARQEHGLAAQVRKAQAEIDTWPDSVRKNHGLPARHDHGDEVQRLREALEEADGHLARAQEKDDRDWARLITNNARVAIRSALSASAEGKA